MYPEADKVRAVIDNGTIQFVGTTATIHPKQPIAHIGLESNEDTPLTPVLTFVAWIVCLAIGVIGFMLPYSRPHQSVQAPDSVKVEKLVVELSSAPTAPIEDDRPPGTAGSSIHSPADAMPPPPIAVAQPSAAVAFAVPVEGPTRVVPFNQATYARSSQTASRPCSRSCLVRGPADRPLRTIPSRQSSKIRRALLLFGSWSLRMEKSAQPKASNPAAGRC